jgi:hypothetical protein
MTKNAKPSLFGTFSILFVRTDEQIVQIALFCVIILDTVSGGWGRSGQLRENLPVYFCRLASFGRSIGANLLSDTLMFRVGYGAVPDLERFQKNYSREGAETFNAQHSTCSIETIWQRRPAAGRQTARGPAFLTERGSVTRSNGRDPDGSDWSQRVVTDRLAAGGSNGSRPRGYIFAWAPGLTPWLRVTDPRSDRDLLRSADDKSAVSLVGNRQGAAGRSQRNLSIARWFLQSMLNVECF